MAPPHLGAFIREEILHELGLTFSGRRAEQRSAFRL